MARYQVILAYDGSPFRGFQKQSKALAGSTVQGIFETALHQLGWPGQSILAAGRTDTGVHAEGQVVAFDLDWSHTPEELRDALNAHLPRTVAVQGIRVAPPGFHPRYDALSRRYRYRVYCRAVPDPFRDPYAWRVWPVVDLERMWEASSLLPGRRDFAAFGTPPRSGGSTVRTVNSAEWSSTGEDLSFEISGDAFLYHMVRRLVFLQVAIGQGRLKLEDFQSCLDHPPRFPVQGLAPARGLALVEVTY